MRQRVLQNMGCPQLGATYYYRLISSAWWPYSLPEPLYDRWQNCEQLYLMTFEFCIVTALRIGSGHSRKSGKLSWKENTGNIIRCWVSKKLVVRKIGWIFWLKKVLLLLEMLERRHSRPRTPMTPHMRHGVPQDEIRFTRSKRLDKYLGPHSRERKKYRLDTNMEIANGLTATRYKDFFEIVPRALNKGIWPKTVKEILWARINRVVPRWK